MVLNVTPRDKKHRRLGLQRTRCLMCIGVRKMDMNRLKGHQLRKVCQLAEVGSIGF